MKKYMKIKHIKTNNFTIKIAYILKLELEFPCIHCTKISKYIHKHVLKITTYMIY